MASQDDLPKQLPWTSEENRIPVMLPWTSFFLGLLLSMSCALIAFLAFRGIEEGQTRWIIVGIAVLAMLLGEGLIVRFFRRLGKRKTLVKAGNKIGIYQGDELIHQAEVQSSVMTVVEGLMDILRAVGFVGAILFGALPFFADDTEWTIIIVAVVSLSLPLLASMVMTRLVCGALQVTESAEKVDILATAKGGGMTGQADALRLGIARALIQLDPDLRPALKKAGMLTRDARIKERKKYGLAGARKRFQFSKR